MKDQRPRGQFRGRVGTLCVDKSSLPRSSFLFRRAKKKRKGKRKEKRTFRNADEFSQRRGGWNPNETQASFNIHRTSTEQSMGTCLLAICRVTEMGRGHLVTTSLFSEDGVFLPHGVKSVPILGHRMHDDDDEDDDEREVTGVFRGMQFILSH